MQKTTFSYTSSFSRRGNVSKLTDEGVVMDTDDDDVIKPEVPSLPPIRPDSAHSRKSSTGSGNGGGRGDPVSLIRIRRGDVISPASNASSSSQPGQNLSDGYQSTHRLSSSQGRSDSGYDGLTRELGRSRSWCDAPSKQQRPLEPLPEKYPAVGLKETVKSHTKKSNAVAPTPRSNRSYTNLMRFSDTPRAATQQQQHPQHAPGPITRAKTNLTIMKRFSSEKDLTESVRGRSNQPANRPGTRGTSLTRQERRNSKVTAILPTETSSRNRLPQSRSQPVFNNKQTSNAKQTKKNENVVEGDHDDDEKEQRIIEWLIGVREADSSRPPTPVTPIDSEPPQTDTAIHIVYNGDS